jgi:hypothetical protein
VKWGGEKKQRREREHHDRSQWTTHTGKRHTGRCQLMHTRGSLLTLVLCYGVVWCTGWGSEGLTWDGEKEEAGVEEEGRTLTVNRPPTMGGGWRLVSLDCNQHTATPTGGR